MSIRRKRPEFSAAEAKQLAHDLFGLDTRVTELPSERDQNFRCETAELAEYVLKIANSAEDRTVLDLQNQAMARIGAPRVCPTREGQTIAAANGHFVRLVTFLPGIPLGQFRPHRPELLRRIGNMLGRIDSALAGLEHPAADRDLYWDIRNAARIISTYKPLIEEHRKRTMIDRFLDAWNTQAVPVLPLLRTSVIHNDANDYNVIVAADGAVNVIDFGDMLRTCTVAEAAIAAAYAMLSKPDPIAAAAHIIAGYHETHPLSETELDVLYPFICARLFMSVTIAAHQKQFEPGNEYLEISERPAWALLDKLAGVHERLARYAFREACGMPACPQSASVAAYLKATAGKDGFASVVAADLKSPDAVVLDFSIGSLELGTPDEAADTTRITGSLFAAIRDRGGKVGVGRYNEARGVYTSELFRTEGNEGPEWRTVHLGIDLFMPHGSPVIAPLDGFVHSFRNNAALLDYGPTIILNHPMPGGGEFYTLYGHLSSDSLNGLTAGTPVARGQRIGAIGNFPENGNWAPHVHFQIITDMLDRDGEFPGVASPGKRELWLSLSPDPNLILGIPEERFPKPVRTPERTLELRRRFIGPSLRLSYRKPLKIVRGYRQYLYDEAGRAYLDCVNNVAHVGHCHPRVVAAGQAQLAVLNTNSRYLHDNIVEYAGRLCEKLPSPLSVCYFVNSGSEANDLALRLARTHAKTEDTIVVDGAYHGNLISLIGVSPYKFDGPGGTGLPARVRKVSTRPGDFGEVRSPAAFIVEPVLSCAGQVVLPAGYLDDAFRRVRAAAGVCIADEVQTGFGRPGTHFWAFESQGVVPDIVTMGKPIGNGHPLGAVVTTPEIAASFNNGMEYFNTYGGNPVSCAIGLAVLDVIEDEKLQQNALRVGSYLKDALLRAASRHPQISDVRGVGLFLGVELVRPDDASYIVERMKESGILLSVDGPLHNVIKIKPPLVFTEQNADTVADVLERTLNETRFCRA